MQTFEYDHKTNLTLFLAEACHYAQEHVGDPEAWDHSKSELEYLMQIPSYQVACFLAQNTVDGHDGVDWDIALDHLCQMPPKNSAAWVRIIRDLAKEFGGWKD